MPRPHHVRARPPMPSLCGQTHQGPNSSLSPSGNLRVLASQEPWAETAHGAWWPLNEAGAICLLPTAAASLASLSESSGPQGHFLGMEWCLASLAASSLNQKNPQTNPYFGFNLLKGRSKTMLPGPKVYRDQNYNPGLAWFLCFHLSVFVFDTRFLYTSPQPGFCHQQAQDWGLTSRLLCSPP